MTIEVQVLFELRFVNRTLMRKCRSPSVVHKEPHTTAYPLPVCSPVLDPVRPYYRPCHRPCLPLS